MDDRGAEPRRWRRGPQPRPRKARGRRRASTLTRRIGSGPAALLVVLLAACGGGGASKTTTTAAPFVLGTTQGEAVGATVDGIQCQRMEQVLFHIHAHLAVFYQGRPQVIPEGIGIAPPRSVEPGPFVLGGSCFYWLHSHTNDGVVHIESPIQRTFTLGNYFDLWNQPLSSTQVAGAKGTVTAYVDGRQSPGDPRNIPLGPHSVIQLDVAENVPPVAYAFQPGL